MDRYASYLLDGFTLDNIMVKASTIQEYMRAVNVHYSTLGLAEPYHRSSASIAATLLREQRLFDTAPVQRDPLHYRTIVRMHQLALTSNPHGFRQAVWLWTALGRLGGFRLQEFVMDRADTIGKYVLPNGTTVVRAFTLKNFIFYTADNERLTGQQALDRHDDIVRFATEYDIQKNRVNGQLIMFAREDRFPDFCPVRLALSIVRLATDLGASAPEDPLCLYRTDLGDVQYLTGEAIT